jgi:hypothetical protein
MATIKARATGEEWSLRKRIIFSPSPFLSLLLHLWYPNDAAAET